MKIESPQKLRSQQRTAETAVFLLGIHLSLLAQSMQVRIINNSLLIGCHYLYRCNGRLLPYADTRCAGLFAVREHRTLITPKGKARILELLEFIASESEAAS